MFYFHVVDADDEDDVDNDDDSEHDEDNDDSDNVEVSKHPFCCLFDDFENCLQFES